jgi:hypothetical protein
MNLQTYSGFYIRMIKKGKLNEIKNILQIKLKTLKERM